MAGFAALSGTSHLIYSQTLRCHCQNSDDWSRTTTTVTSLDRYTSNYAQMDTDQARHHRSLVLHFETVTSTSRPHSSRYDCVDAPGKLNNLFPSLCLFAPFQIPSTQWVRGIRRSVVSYCLSPLASFVTNFSSKIGPALHDALLQPLHSLPRLPHTRTSSSPTPFPALITRQTQDTIANCARSPIEIRNFRTFSGSATAQGYVAF